MSSNNANETATGTDTPSLRLLYALNFAFHHVASAERERPKLTADLRPVAIAAARAIGEGSETLPESMATALIRITGMVNDTRVVAVNLPPYLGAATIDQLCLDGEQEALIEIEVQQLGGKPLCHQISLGPKPYVNISFSKSDLPLPPISNKDRKWFAAKAEALANNPFARPKHSKELVARLSPYIWQAVFGDLCRRPVMLPASRGRFLAGQIDLLRKTQTEGSEGAPDGPLVSEMDRALLRQMMTFQERDDIEIKIEPGEHALVKPPDKDGEKGVWQTLREALNNLPQRAAQAACQRLAQEIEDVIGGRIDSLYPRGWAMPFVAAQPYDEDVSKHLSAAPPTVAEAAGIVLYLKYWAKSGDLLYIEPAEGPSFESEWRPLVEAFASGDVFDIADDNRLPGAGGLMPGRHGVTIRTAGLNMNPAQALEPRWPEDDEPAEENEPATAMSPR